MAEIVIIISDEEGTVLDTFRIGSEILTKEGLAHVVKKLIKDDRFDIVQD